MKKYKPLYESNRHAYFEMRQSLNSKDLDKENVFINLLTNKLNSKLSSDELITQNLFISTLKHIEKYRVCSSETALALIKSCNINFAYKLPNERQYYLNYMFYQLFPELNVHFEQTHYECYMINTHVNKAAFDPFDLELRMIQMNIKPNETINYFTIKQLCESSRIELALARFKTLLERNLNPVVLDLANINKDEQTESRLYEAVLKELKLKDKTDLDLISKYVVDYFSLCMNYYNTKQEIDKSLEMFTLLNDELKLKTNSQVYRNLIESFLQSNEIDKAKQVFVQHNEAIDFADLLTIFTTVELKYKNEIGEDFRNAFLESMRSKAQNNQGRFLLIDKIYELNEKGHFDFLAHLMQRLYYSNESANEKQVQSDTDPIEKRIDVSEFLCNSTVNNQNRTNEMVIVNAKKIAQILNEPDELKHIKLMIYYAALKNDYTLSIYLMDYLVQRGVKLNFNYFLPLIKSTAIELETKMNEKIDIRVESTIQYVRMCSLFKLAFDKYNCDFSYQKLFLIFHTLYTLNSSELIHKRKLSMLNIANCLTQSFGQRSNILNFFIERICKKRCQKIESLSTLKNFGLNLKIIYADFAEIADLIAKLHPKSMERTLENLKSYLVYVVRTDLFTPLEFINLEENVLLRTLKLLNEMCAKNPEMNNLNAMKEINDMAYDYIMKILMNHEIEKSQFDKYFKEQINLLKNVNENATKKETKTQNQVEDLENKIKNLKNNNENFYPFLRLLIIHLCNSYVKRSYETTKLSKWVNQLPESELTPMICQDLMQYYSDSVRNLEKAKYFCEKMFELTSQGNEQVFCIDSRKLLSFIKFVYMRNRNVYELQLWLDKASNFKKSNDSNEFNAELLRFIYDHIYSNLNGLTLKKLVETMISSKFANRNHELVSMVLSKFIQKQNLDNAFEYFKYNVTNFQLSTLEVILLSAMLEKGTYNKQVDDFLSLYEPDLAQNMLLFAHILNKQHIKANNVFMVKLKKTVDLKVLERFASQIQRNEMLRKKYNKDVWDLMKYRPFAENTELKSEIISIIKGIFK